MRATQYPFFTLRFFPKSIDTISHKLMIRSGMIRQLSSGIYIWLPTGIRVLKKVENIIRKEMLKSGATEIAMPLMQPSELWEKSKRLKKYGSELFKFYDRHKRSFILGPTHEEVITTVIKNEIRSYKELPIKLFQIHTKFRDEIRPKSGVIRSREFIMKDLYSFHITKSCLKNTYEDIYNKYCKIFKKINLNFSVVKADSGSIGGNISHEFHIISKTGEDKLVFSSSSNFSSTIDLAEIEYIPEEKKLISFQPLKKIFLETNDFIKIKKIYKISSKNIVKTFLVKSKNISSNFVFLLLRADHQINKLKIEKLDIIYNPLTFATKKQIYKLTGCEDPKFIGPVGLEIPIIADYSVVNMNNFIVGANIKNHYFLHVNWKRDLLLPYKIADIRNAETGDIIKNRKEKLIIKNGIEIAHIFQLDDIYTKYMNFYIRDKIGYNKFLYMGCYGIGINRIIAACIEQNHDQKGILWPDCIAPFQVAILPINMKNSSLVKKKSEIIYNEFINHNIDVILDDREKHLGLMITDMNLIGVPHNFIISKNFIINNKIEYKSRFCEKISIMDVNSIINFIKNKNK